MIEDPASRDKEHPAEGKLTRIILRAVGGASSLSKPFHFSRKDR